MVKNKVGEFPGSRRKNTEKRKFEDSSGKLNIYQEFQKEHRENGGEEIIHERIQENFSESKDLGFQIKRACLMSDIKIE